jgi:hypothetical protein
MIMENKEIDKYRIAERPYLNTGIIEYMIKRDDGCCFGIHETFDDAVKYLKKIEKRLNRKRCII